MSKRPQLRVNIASMRPQDSFYVQEGEFIKGDIHIGTSGVRVSEKKESTAEEDRIRTKVPFDPDDLEYLKLLGRGASSYVQHVVDRKTGLDMALKIINFYDRARRQQLISEIRALFAADCDALVEFYGAFFREGSISVALEYMDRGSLENYIGRVPEHVLANMTFQMLWGLGYLKHEKRVHRDVKPQNVLVNSRGHVKLTDFGISRELENSVGFCATYVGTFKYMSPERINSQTYSFSSDIWSLGLVLLTVASGRHPFAECNTVVDMCQTVMEAEDAIRKDVPGWSAEFTEFVENSLEDARANVFAWIQESEAAGAASAKAAAAGHSGK